MSCVQVFQYSGMETTLKLGRVYIKLFGHIQMMSAHVWFAVPQTPLRHPKLHGHMCTRLPLCRFAAWHQNLILGDPGVKKKNATKWYGTCGSSVGHQKWRLASQALDASWALELDWPHCFPRTSGKVSSTPPGSIWHSLECAGRRMPWYKKVPQETVHPCTCALVWMHPLSLFLCPVCYFFLFFYFSSTFALLSYSASFFSKTEARIFFLWLYL